MAAGDLCESVDEYLQNDFFSSSVATTTANHYLFCGTTPALQDLVNEVQNLTQMANASLHDAEKSGNQTVWLIDCDKYLTVVFQEIAYWKRILQASEILSSDVNIMLSCDVTAQAYHDAKYRMCTDLLYVLLVGNNTSTYTSISGLVLLS